jgi:hypothetical protein
VFECARGHALSPWVLRARGKIDSGRCQRESGLAAVGGPCQNAHMRKARPLYAGEEVGLDIANTIYALDSTTVDLSLTLFPWASFRKTKAGIKMHTQIDLRGPIPTCVMFSGQRSHSSSNAAESSGWRPGKTLTGLPMASWKWGCSTGVGDSPVAVENECAPRHSRAKSPPLGPYGHLRQNRS